METELLNFIETQKIFNEETTKAIELLSTNIGIMNERIKVSHDRMDLQGKQLDTILEMAEKLRQRVHNLQEWKIEKEGI